MNNEIHKQNAEMIKIANELMQIALRLTTSAAGHQDAITQQKIIAKKRITRARQRRSVLLPNHNKIWTDADFKSLMTGVEMGMTDEQIALALGRDPKAIRAQMNYRMNKAAHEAISQSV